MSHGECAGETSLTSTFSVLPVGNSTFQSLNVKPHYGGLCVISKRRSTFPLLFTVSPIYLNLLFLVPRKMDRLEETFKAACANGGIPGAVLSCTNKTGSFTYTKYFGVQSLDDNDDTPMDEETLLTLTSCTKIVTAIAVMQIVEKGLIGLDDEIDEVLPELAALKILTAMEGGKPTFVERKNPITLR